MKVGVGRGLGQLLDVGRISAAPARIQPTASGSAWRTLCQKAVTRAAKMRPDASVTVRR
jgi:hypothetical protein